MIRKVQEAQPPLINVETETVVLSLEAATRFWRQAKAAKRTTEARWGRYARGRSKQKQAEAEATYESFWKVPSS